MSSNKDLPLPPEQFLLIETSAQRWLSRTHTAVPPITLLSLVQISYSSLCPGTINGCYSEWKRCILGSTNQLMPVFCLIFNNVSYSAVSCSTLLSSNVSPIWQVLLYLSSGQTHHHCATEERSTFGSLFSIPLLLEDYCAARWSLARLPLMTMELSVK